MVGEASFSSLSVPLEKPTPSAKAAQIKELLKISNMSYNVCQPIFTVLGNGSMGCICSSYTLSQRSVLGCYIICCGSRGKKFQHPELSVE